MIVVVAGMKRSGTTWMFNVVRVALGDPQVVSDMNGVDGWDGTGDLVVKTHWWNPDLADVADVTFASDRDVEEVYWSLRRLWGREPTGREMAKIVEHSRRWSAVADWTMPYRTLVDKPFDAVERIVSLLGVPVDPVAVYANVDAIRPPESGQDPVTLYFANHRAGT